MTGGLGKKSLDAKFLSKDLATNGEEFTQRERSHHFAIFELRTRCIDRILFVFGSAFLHPFHHQSQ